MSTTHVPAIEPRPKMDTPTGLFNGACSCGWRSDGLESERGAWRSAESHANALNARREAQAPQAGVHFEHDENTVYNFEQIRAVLGRRITPQSVSDMTDEDLHELDAALTSMKAAVHIVLMQRGLNGPMFDIAGGGS